MILPKEIPQIRNDHE